MFKTRNIIGIAVDEVGIVAAELHYRAGHSEVRRVGQLNFEKKLNCDNVKELGQKLRHFLRINHFSSKQAIIGIPTKWIIAKEITAPPASTDALAGMLSIQAERTFSLNSSELVFDYFGRTSLSEKREVLLLGARLQIIDLITELASTAGLQVKSITVSALALSKALSRKGPEYKYGLYTRPTYCEYWTQVNGTARSIMHIPISGKDGTEDDHIEQLVAMIQRMVLLSSQKGQFPPYQITAYDGIGLSDETINRLNERLTPQVTITNGSPQLLTKRLSFSGYPVETQSIAAIAVATTVTGTDKPPVDFLNPRIGVKKTSRRKTVTVWAGIIGFACFLVLAALLIDWQADRRDIATYTEQLEMKSEDITAAQEVVDRISYASSWTSQEPIFLNCLRELTLTFPEEPSVWATNLRLSENAGAALVGKAVDEKSFYEVLDRIKEQKAFTNVQMIHIRDAGRDSKEKEFAVHFEFKGEK
ncbi:MAG: pilus assembly protein PilM [Sedimentisphaerales bacterium]|nr:pilus assembly protein PilM [Sedimentisphaerales bacterium]